MTPERTSKLLSTLYRRQPDITVLLENISDPHNISAVLRTCDAVGIPEIFVLSTMKKTQKKWDFHSARSAWKWVKVHQFTDETLCLEAVRKRFPRILTSHLGGDSVGLYEVDFTEPAALVFGNERHGVSDSLRSKGDGDFQIPQMGMITSLNVSVACAVTLYEAFRQKEMAGHYLRPKMTETAISLQMEEWSIRKPPLKEES